MAKELINEYGAEDVTASLVKLLFDKETNYEYGDTEDSVSTDDMARLFMSVGKLDKATPKDIIKFLDESAGVKSKDIGRIDILDKFSFIDVPESLVDGIIANCSGNKIGKRRVNIEVSNKKRR
ncbi:ATP-dependent RNA helicase DeaD [bioreactor metagenome]|uniref:ATP-dependent RNA helicase DeaD n=1 Tax=bioreactor metagenome TaxID=1076179 RepID=A0A645ID41_9ZZZZ